MISLGGVTYSHGPDQAIVTNPDDPFDDNWLFLEQEYFPPTRQHADFGDVYNMFVRAQSGLSAQSYVLDACPVAVYEDATSIVIPLEFYVFVPRDDFEYELTSNAPEEFDPEEPFVKGTFTNDGVGYVQKGYTTAFTMTDQLQFNHRIADLSYWWESPVYDTFGRRIRGPSGAGGGINRATSLDELRELAAAGVTVNISPTQLRARGRYITAGEDIFGVVRLKYRAIARLHKLELRIHKQSQYLLQRIEGNKITRLWFDPQVIAKWEVNGVTKTQALSLQIPQCVYDSLYICPNGVRSILLINPYKDKYIVYYSTCDGSFLGVREAGSFKKDYLRAKR